MEAKEKVYEVVDLPMKEQKGKKIPGTVSFNENGSTYTAGMKIHLTPERMEQIGKQYFKVAKEKE